MTPEDELQLRLDVVKACKWLNSHRELKKSYFAEFADLSTTALQRAEQGNGPPEKLKRLLFAINEYKEGLSSVNLDEYQASDNDEK